MTATLTFNGLILRVLSEVFLSVGQGTTKAHLSKNIGYFIQSSFREIFLNQSHSLLSVEDYNYRIHINSLGVWVLSNFLNLLVTTYLRGTLIDEWCLFQRSHSLWVFKHSSHFTSI